MVELLLGALAKSDDLRFLEALQQVINSSGALLTTACTSEVQHSLHQHLLVCGALLIDSRRNIQDRIIPRV